MLGSPMSAAPSLCSGRGLVADRDVAVWSDPGHQRAAEPALEVDLDRARLEALLLKPAHVLAGTEPLPELHLERLQRRRARLQPAQQRRCFRRQELARLRIDDRHPATARRGRRGIGRWRDPTLLPEPSLEVDLRRTIRQPLLLDALSRLPRPARGVLPDGTLIEQRPALGPLVRRDQATGYRIDAGGLPRCRTAVRSLDVRTEQDPRRRGGAEEGSCV